MLSLGMDIGTSTVKLVLLKNQEIEKQWMAVHHGNPFVCLKKGLSTLELAMDTPFSLCVTGSNTEALLEQDSAIPSYGSTRKFRLIWRQRWEHERSSQSIPPSV